MNEFKNDTKFKLLELRFNDTYKKCLPYKGDDRRLFVNMVETLLEAIKEMQGVKSYIIKVSFSNKYNEEMEKLSELEISLKERNMIQ